MVMVEEMESVASVAAAFSSFLLLFILLIPLLLLLLLLDVKKVVCGEVLRSSANVCRQNGGGPRREFTVWRLDFTRLVLSPPLSGARVLLIFIPSYIPHPYPIPPHLPYT